MFGALAANSTAEASTAEMASIRNRLAKPTLKTRTTVSTGETRANETWAGKSYHWKSHTGEKSEPRPSQEQPFLASCPPATVEEMWGLVQLSVVLLSLSDRLERIAARNKGGPHLNISTSRGPFQLSLLPLLSSPDSPLRLDSVSLPCLGTVVVNHNLGMVRRGPIDGRAGLRLCSLEAYQKCEGADEARFGAHAPTIHRAIQAFLILW